MNKQRVVQYIIYASILFIALYVGKSMFAKDDETIRNVSQHVPHETTSNTKASATVSDEEKLDFELHQQDKINTLRDLYDEPTITASKQVAEQFAKWAFPYDSQTTKSTEEIKGFVKEDVYTSFLSGRTTNAAAKRTLTTFETYEAYNQMDAIHWVVRLTGDVYDRDDHVQQTVIYDYHIYVKRENNRLWIVEVTPQKVS